MTHQDAHERRLQVRAAAGGEVRDAAPARGRLRAGSAMLVLLLLAMLGLSPASPAAEAEARTTPGAGDVAIHHRLHGRLEDTRPLLVLIHGWSCDSSYWREQIAALAADHAVLTVDLAGHGESAGDREDFSMRSFGEDVQRVVEGLPTRAPVVLIGHSMGGPVAVEAARLLGSRVIGVVGVDTFSNIGLPPPPAADTERRLAAFMRDFPGSTRAFVDRSFFKATANATLRRSIVEDMASADPRVAIAALRGLNAWDGVAGLQALRVPVIAINADLVPTDEARLRAIAPNFRLVTLAGPGHFLMMEEPARFNAALRAALATLR